MKINILIIYILLKYYIIIRITITIITPYQKIKLPSAICHLNLDIIIFDFEKRKDETGHEYRKDRKYDQYMEETPLCGTDGRWQFRKSIIKTSKQ